MSSEGGIPIEQPESPKPPIFSDSKTIMQPDEADQRDCFSRALEMMRRNGTDEQTQRVYANILDVIRLNMSRLDTKPQELTERFDRNSPFFVAGLSMWEKPRVEVPGMPIINANNPANPSFELNPNYHNGPEWLGTVCVDDPTIVNANEEIQLRKPNGELNSTWTVQVIPGDEKTPGNMYSKLPGQEKQLLTPALRQRIDDVFQICRKQSIALVTGRSFIGYVPGDILSELRFRDGKSVGKRERVRDADLYELILRGEITRKNAKTAAVKKLTQGKKPQ